MKKKLFSFALALAVCLGLTVPALAADYTEVIPCQYDRAGDFSEGLAAVAVAVQDETYKDSTFNYRWGFIDKTGKEVIPCKYFSSIVTDTKLSPRFSEGLAVVIDPETSHEDKIGKDREKWGFIDQTGKEVIPFQYHYAHNFSEGLAMAGKKNGKVIYDPFFGTIYEYDYGYIDKTGKEVIPLQYVDARDFSEGLAAVATELQNWGYIDKAGKVVIPFRPYKWVGNFSDGMAIVIDQNDNYGFIDKTGNEVIPCQYAYAWAFSEGLAGVQVGEHGKIGFIDKTGKMVIPAQYSGNDGNGIAYSFSEGLTAARSEKQAYIDKTGKEIIPAPYNSIRGFSEGFAPVNLGGKYGFIDKTGKEVVPCQYAWTCPVSEGMAAVSVAVGGSDWDHMKWGFISLDGAQSAVPAVPTVGNFTDVSASSPYADAIVWAVEQNITTGKTADTFAPGENCTNGQILTFLWRASGSPEPTIDNPFTDSIPASFQKAAVWAYEKGLVSGEAFSASAPCTRAVTVTYLWKAVGSPESSENASFTDVPANAEYAQAVAWAVENGVTSGTGNGQFSPDATCTRGQIVTFLHRAMEK